jgi:hypothetical protein
MRDRELDQRRSSGYEHVPQWGQDLEAKVDALSEKFDGIYAELTKRIAFQRKVIGAFKSAAPTVVPIVVTAIAGHYPQLRAPLMAFLQAIGLWGG